MLRPPQLAMAHHGAPKAHAGGHARRVSQQARTSKAARCAGSMRGTLACAQRPTSKSISRKPRCLARYSSRPTCADTQHALKAPYWMLFCLAISSDAFLPGNVSPCNLQLGPCNAAQRVLRLAVTHCSPARPLLCFHAAL